MMGFPTKKNKTSFIDDNDEEEKMSPKMGMSDGPGGKLLALQNIISGIEDLTDEDLRPYIEKIKNAAHMEHEASEGDEMGMEQAKNAMEKTYGDEISPKKGGAEGIDIEVGMGGPKVSSQKQGPNEEEEENPEKGGFLAILSKRMKAKSGKPQ